MNKQSVIIPLMIVFLATMMVAIGMWFKFDVELDNQKRQIQLLTQIKSDLGGQLEGTEENPGIKRVVEKPELSHGRVGLEKQLTDWTARASEMVGNETSGLTQSKTLYEVLQPEIEKKFGDAGKKWETLYTDWREQNKKLVDQATTLQKVTAERETETEKQQTALGQELDNEDKKRKEVVDFKRAAVKDVSEIRYSQEETQEKINAVTRDVVKVRAVVPLGKIIYAATDLKMFTIDMGSEQGIRKGLQFDVYSAAHANKVLKGRVEIVNVGPSSAEGRLLPPRLDSRVDPQTGWSTTDPLMKYSIYSAAGAEETDAQALEKPKSKADRVEALRIERIEKERGLEAAEAAKRERETPSSPPSEIGKGFNPIAIGDWYANPDFSPIVSKKIFDRQIQEELVTMGDVNIGPLTFFFASSIRPYRAEYLKRLCERNGCKAAATMGPDVNYVVSVPGSLRLDLLEEKLSKVKRDDIANLPKDVQEQLKMLDALKEAKKIGALVIADDEVEALFDRRTRKIELMRGKAIQPGQHSFIVVGQTRERSAEHVARYIQDHGGVMAPDLGAKVDYVVAGANIDAPTLEKVKKLGLKIIREDELPRFFGVEQER